MSRRLVDPSVRDLYLRSEGAGRNLRLGILLDSTAAPAFVREVLRDIEAANFVELQCVVINAESAVERYPKKPWIFRFFGALLDSQRWHCLGFDFYRQIVDPRFRRDPSPLSAVECSDLIGGRPTLMVSPLRSGFVHRFPRDALDWVRTQDLDVILRFGFNILRGEVLGLARYGVWSYHHGDNEYYRGGPALMWELLEHNPVSGVVLQVLNEDLDGGLVLCKALLATTQTPSLSVNRFAPYWVAEHFVIRKLKELHEEGWEAVRARALPSVPYQGKERIYRTPRTWPMVRWAGSRIARSLRSRLESAGRVAHWQIGIRRSSVPLYEDASPAQLKQFRIIESPKGHFWADPFLLERDRRLWLLFEDFDRSTRRGSLRCAEVGADGELGPTQTVLKPAHHLSYPCVVTDGDELYLLPESEAAGGLDLYRAKRFPGEWEHVGRLLDFPVVDATPFKRGGEWWMYASPMIVRGHTPLTMLFQAPALEGPWRQVRCSPIAADARFARCGGAVIQDGMRLIRPSQDTSVAYGRALIFNHVELLSETQYRETPLMRITPSWLDRQVGVHTYNRVSDWEVIDVNLMRRSSEIL